MKTIDRIIDWLSTGFVLFFSAAFVSVLFTGSTQAAPQCDAYDRVLTLLTDRYGESLIGRGVAGGATRLEMFAHPDGGTWSVLVVMPDGTACLVASGAGWEVLTPPPGGEDI